MINSEVKEAEGRVLVYAVRNNGAVGLEIAREVVGGPEGRLEQVVQSLKRKGYCKVVLSNEDYEGFTFMLVLTPEGLEYAASLIIEEPFENWPGV